MNRERSILLFANQSFRLNETVKISVCKRDSFIWCEMSHPCSCANPLLVWFESVSCRVLGFTHQTNQAIVGYLKKKDTTDLLVSGLPLFIHHLYLRRAEGTPFESVQFIEIRWRMLL